jgi:hypothetical protein
MPHDVHYQMRSKHLTNLSIFILHLKLGSVEGYYKIDQVEEQPGEFPQEQDARP